MLSKVILAVTILALAVPPAPASAWGGGDGGHQGVQAGPEPFRSRGRFGHFRRPSIGVYEYPSYVYVFVPPACSWREGHWGPNQPYIDENGFERFEPAWMPAQWVCH
jgi:hypothetical protein